MTTALANKQGQLAPLKHVDPKDVLERYLAEEKTADIAASLGVTFAGLSHWLIQHAEGEWKSAQIVLALKRKMLADERLETAENALELARAREQLRSAQWDLERVCRRIYGQDAPPNSVVPVQININMGASHPQAIDITATAIPLDRGQSEKPE